MALGGQPQEATMFDLVVASTGGVDFYKKASIDLDESALSREDHEEVVRESREAA